MNYYKTTIQRLSHIGLFTLFTISLFIGTAHANHTSENHPLKVALTSDEHDFIEQYPEVVLAGGTSFEPFLIRNLGGSDNISGYDVDIANLISQRTGLKIKFELGVWNDIQKKAQNRELDGLSTAQFNDERAAYYNSSLPYIALTKYALVRHGNPKKIHSLNDLGGKTVALQKGNTLFDDILDNTITDIKVVYFNSIHEVIKAVASGSADMTVLDESTPYIAQKLGLADSIEIAFPTTDEPFELVFLLRNDRPQLTTIFNKGLMSITSDERDAIKKHWFTPMEKQIDYSFFLKVVATISIVLLGIFYWSYKLHLARDKMKKALNEIEKKDKELNIKNKMLEQLAVTDRLTGLYNRVRLDEAIDQEAIRASRYPVTFGVILADIDLFKSVNDTYGHQVGDQTLVEVAEILKESSREVDVVGRWGGEEFLIISPNTDADGLTKLAEKLRANIERHDFPVIKSKTVSFGMTIYQKDDTSHGLIAKADRALYIAKENGRNRVEAVWD